MPKKKNEKKQNKFNVKQQVFEEDQTPLRTKKFNFPFLALKGIKIFFR